MICGTATQNWRTKSTCSARSSTRSWRSRSEFCTPVLSGLSETVSPSPCTSKRAGYESVRKWTSKVDVFSKKYLVIPINEQ